MRGADVSQLPVLDHNRLVGILDESDVLAAVEGADEQRHTRFKAPVSSAMTSALHTVQVDQPLEALLPVFERNEVAIVLDGEAFVGLITRVDLINHLRLSQ
jgi:cystathionine beta-synthase